MAALSDAERAALGYWWQLVSDAARNGLTVTDTVSMVKQVATDMGTSLSFQEYGAVSKLYGYARREVNAGSALQSAPSDRYIDSSMMSSPPYAQRSAQEMTTYPLYHVRMEYTYIDKSGVQRTDYKTSVFADTLPGTVGELTSAVLDDAEAMASKYGHTLISAVPINIMVV